MRKVTESVCGFLWIWTAMAFFFCVGLAVTLGNSRRGRTARGGIAAAAIAMWGATAALHLGLARWLYPGHSGATWYLTAALAIVLALPVTAGLVALPWTIVEMIKGAQEPSRPKMLSKG